MKSVLRSVMKRFKNNRGHVPALKYGYMEHYEARISDNFRTLFLVFFFKPILQLIVNKNFTNRLRKNNRQIFCLIKTNTEQM